MALGTKGHWRKLSPLFKFKMIYSLNSDWLQNLVHKYKDLGQKYETINLSNYISIISYFIDNFVDSSNNPVRRKRSLPRIYRESLKIILLFKDEIEKSKEKGESPFAPLGKYNVGQCS